MIMLIIAAYSCVIDYGCLVVVYKFKIIDDMHIDYDSKIHCLRPLKTPV